MKDTMDRKTKDPMTLIWRWVDKYVSGLSYGPAYIEDYDVEGADEELEYYFRVTLEGKEYRFRLREADINDMSKDVEDEFYYERTDVMGNTVVGSGALEGFFPHWWVLGKV
jgi:hypothetical protein